MSGTSTKSAGGQRLLRKGEQTRGTDRIPAWQAPKARQAPAAWSSSTRAAHRRSSRCCSPRRWPAPAGTAGRAGRHRQRPCWILPVSRATPFPGPAPGRQATRPIIAALLDRLADGGAQVERWVLILAGLIGVGHRAAHGGDRFQRLERWWTPRWWRSASSLGWCCCTTWLDPGLDRSDQRHPARTTAGSRVRYRVPPDHAGRRLPLREDRGDGYGVWRDGSTAPATASSASGPPPRSAWCPAACAWSPPISATAAAPRRSGTACRWTPRWD